MFKFRGLKNRGQYSISGQGKYSYSKGPCENVGGDKSGTFVKSVGNSEVRKQS